MSIIYDALKKLEGNDKSGSSQEEPGKNLTQPKKSRWSLNKKIISILIVILAVTILVFSFTVGRQYLLEKASSLFSLIKKGDLSDQQKSLGFKLPLPSKSVPGSGKAGVYRLDGIIYDLDFPVAIINGNTLKEEDLVGEYRVVEITESTVELVNINDQTKLILSIGF
ncbi:MAG: hypothetical protein K9L86_04460 [Candidatus Omnitrophica bacterium]|nr:hypothetical protein [Candidatus Omnitrophota bacterium]